MNSRHSGRDTRSRVDKLRDLADHPTATAGERANAMAEIERMERVPAIEMPARHRHAGDESMVFVQARDWSSTSGTRRWSLDAPPLRVFITEMVDPLLSWEYSTGGGRTELSTRKRNMILRQPRFTVTAKRDFSYGYTDVGPARTLEEAIRLGREYVVQHVGRA